MKNHALPNSHFCIKISKVPNSRQQESREAYSAFLKANHVLEMSVKLKFQCVYFENHRFTLVVLNWFPICFCQVTPKSRTIKLFV